METDFCSINKVYEEIQYHFRGSKFLFFHGEAMLYLENRGFTADEAQEYLRLMHEDVTQKE